MKRDEPPGPDLFGPGEIDDTDERRLVERLERTIGESPGRGRSALIRTQLRPEHSESGRKTLARFKAHLDRNAEVSCDAENLFTLDDCPSLPPLEGIGQRFVPPFAGGRMLFRRVEGGETMFSNAVITETSACIDAMSWVGKERAVAGFGIPFFPRLGALPLHRLRITAHLHGFWEWDNFWSGDVPGRRCGFTNRGVVKLVVPGVAGAVSEWILHDSECEGSRQGALPATLALELSASLEPRVHVAWLVIEACVEPPPSRSLLCLEALADGNQPPGVPIDECDGAGQASAGITMAACAIDLAYRERTVQEVERERLAEELRDRVRLP